MFFDFIKSESLQITGAVIGLIGCFFLFWSIYKEKETGIKQNYVSWFLWAILDFISFYSIYLEKGNYYLPLIYAIGAGSISVLLFLKRKNGITRLEWLMVIFVFSCVFFWKKEGNDYAIIASIIAIFLSTIPQIIDTYEEPKETPTKIYIIFAIAEFISILGGKKENFTEEILYPLSELFLCLVIIILSIKVKRVTF